MLRKISLALVAVLALTACGNYGLEPYDPSPDGENYLEQPESGGQDVGDETGGDLDEGGADFEDAAAVR